MELKVIAETNHFIVVKKPAGIPSQGDKTEDLDMLTLIKQYLKEKYQKPSNVYLGLVHRLDRPVSGLMVFAKTSKAAARLSEQVREHQLEKWYLVVCDGKLEHDSGAMEDYLLKDERNNTSKVVVKGTKNSKLAKLEYEVLKYREDNNISLVMVKLHTGRHHQIRVQFSSRGNSLYGDQKYGIRGRQKNIALFAYHLSFLDPVTHERLEYEILPEKKRNLEYIRWSYSVKSIRKKCKNMSMKSC